jgi:hypothetical protein
MKSSLSRLAIFAMLLSLAAAALLRAQENPSQPETLTATVVGTSGAASGKAFGITININSYSTEGDASLLLEAVQSGKKNELLNTLQSMSAKGRTIRILIDRQMSFFELTRGTRSREYQFSALELYLDEKGNGDGLLYPAAKLKINKATNQLELEDYGQARCASPTFWDGNNRSAFSAARAKTMYRALRKCFRRGNCEIQSELLPRLCWH